MSDGGEQLDSLHRGDNGSDTLVPHLVATSPGPLLLSENPMGLETALCGHLPPVAVAGFDPSTFNAPGEILGVLPTISGDEFMVIAAAQVGVGMRWFRPDGTSSSGWVTGPVAADLVLPGLQSTSARAVMVDTDDVGTRFQAYDRKTGTWATPVSLQKGTYFPAILPAKNGWLAAALNVGGVELFLVNDDGKATATMQLTPGSYPIPMLRLFRSDDKTWVVTDSADYSSLLVWQLPADPDLTGMPPKAIVLPVGGAQEVPWLEATGGAVRLVRFATGTDATSGTFYVEARGCY